MYGKAFKNATNLEELIAFRILQGLAGGGLISTAQAVLIETWPREDVGIATALFGLSGVVGPTIGGYLLEISSWPLIFYVNILVGILAAYCNYLPIVMLIGWPDLFYYAPFLYCIYKSLKRTLSSRPTFIN